MQKFKSYNEAVEAAEQYFIRNFNFTSNTNVGVESADGNIIEFYSKFDPGMDDTFTCMVNDGNEYRCKNGGQLQINGFIV